MQNGKEIAELIKKGISKYYDEKYEEAIEDYDKVLELDPNNSVALFNKCNALNELGLPKEAITCYDKILEAGTDFFPSFLKTVKDLKIDLIFPIGATINDVYILCCKANQLEELKRYEDAVVCYDKALEFDPKNSGVLISKVNDLEHLQRFEDVIKCCDKILEYFSGDTGALYHKAHALEDLGEYEKAIHCYDEILKIYPDSSSALYNKQVATENINSKKSLK